jgi:nucleotide-binding universal stress UspA family protein
MTTAVINGSVVVGVDGSPHSEAAIEWAVRYAKGHRRPLTIVHAAGSIARENTLVDPAVTRQSLRMAGRQVTEKVLGEVQKLAPDLEVAVHMPLDEPREVLLAAAQHASLMVLGTRGRGTIATFLLGSVSVGVSAHAHCPTVVVRASHAAETGHVVVGVDGTPASEGGLEFAYEMASWLGRPLDVVHTWGGDGPYPALLTYEQRKELMDDRELRVAESLAGFGEKYPDVAVAQYIVENDPAKALVIASEKAALVVVGSRGHGDAASVLLGSVSRSVVEHARGSVAVVHPG